MISKEKKKLMLQYAAAITASLTRFGFGSIMSWPSPALSYLMSEKSYMPISKEEADWITSLLLPGFIIGYLINPIINDKLGPKRTLLILCLPQITSWMMINLATKSNTICIGRLIGGIGYGGGLSATVLYVSEIDKYNRGRFTVFLPLFSTVGTLASLVIGSYLSYKSMNMLLLMVPIFFFIIFTFMPNYADFKRRNRRSEEKMNNLMNLEELQETEEHVSKIKRTRLWKLFMFRNNRRALIILTICPAVVVFSGDSILTNFSQQIFTYNGSVISGANSAMIVSGIRIFGCLIATQVMEKFRRKVLLLAAGILGSIGMGLVGLYFLLAEQKVDVSFIRLMPVVGVALYNVMVPIGWQNLYIVYESELFSQDVKSVGVLFCNIFYSIFVFLELFRFHQLIDIVGYGTLFMAFAFNCAIGTFLLFVITPETKGRKLEEIQELLKSKRTFFCSM